MVDRLVLHIGDYKTGSTSIQSCLSQGSYDIAGTTVLYPTRATHHMQLARALSRFRKQPITDTVDPDLVHRITTSPADLAVLSAEHFISVPPRKVREWLTLALPDLLETTQVIAYVRPHASFLLSLYAEHTKLGWTTLSFDAYLAHMLDQRNLKYHVKFTRWQRNFAPGFSLRPMLPDALTDGDVVTDFLTQIADGAAVTLHPQGTANRSLDAVDLGFVRQVQDRLASLDTALSGQKRRQLGNWLHDTLSATPSDVAPVPLRMSRHAYDRIVQTCRADARAMDASYFQGTPLMKALRADTRLVDDALADIAPPITDRHLGICRKLPVPERAQITAALTDLAKA
jgi:hypothetical protein